jgi:hypothetical protein
MTWSYSSLGRLAQIRYSGGIRVLLDNLKRCCYDTCNATNNQRIIQSTPAIFSFQSWTTDVVITVEKVRERHTCTALLEKMAHFSLLMEYGAGRSSQCAIPFVIFSSSRKGNLSVISISTFSQCCQGAKISVAELKRNHIKTCMGEKLGVKFCLDMLKKRWKWVKLLKQIIKIFVAGARLFG